MGSILPAQNLVQPLKVEEFKVAVHPAQRSWKTKWQISIVLTECVETLPRKPHLFFFLFFFSSFLGFFCFVFVLLEYAFYTDVEGADTKAISMRKLILSCCSVWLKVSGGRTGTPPGSCQEKEPRMVWNQQTKELISARKRNTSTRRKTWVAYGNSYLAYKLARFGLATRQY